MKRYKRFAVLILGLGCFALSVLVILAPRKERVSVTFLGFKDTPSGETLALFTFTNRTANRLVRRSSEVEHLGNLGKPIVLDEWLRGSGEVYLEPQASKNFALPVARTPKNPWRLRSTYVGQPGKLEQALNDLLVKGRALGLPIPARLLRPPGLWNVESDWITPKGADKPAAPNARPIAPKRTAAHRIGLEAT